MLNFFIFFASERNRLFARASKLLRQQNYRSLQLARPLSPYYIKDMPFGILNYVFTKYRFDDWDTIKGIIWPYGIGIAVIYGIRRWSAGGTNQSLRNLASKVILITVLSKTCQN